MGKSVFRKAGSAEHCSVQARWLYGYSLVVGSDRRCDNEERGPLFCSLHHLCVLDSELSTESVESMGTGPVRAEVSALHDVCSHDLWFLCSVASHDTTRKLQFAPCAGPSERLERSGYRCGIQWFPDRLQ